MFKGSIKKIGHDLVGGGDVARHGNNGAEGMYVRAYAAPLPPPPPR
jgi:hypothetical protein